LKDQNDLERKRKKGEAGSRHVSLCLEVGAVPEGRSGEKFSIRGGKPVTVELSANRKNVGNGKSHRLWKTRENGKKTAGPLRRGRVR